jgi:hypothetical protein
MRRSLEFGMVVIVILLAVIISLAVHKGSNPSEAAVLKRAPQMCIAGYSSPQCWAVSATPRESTTQHAVSHFLLAIWSANGAGENSVLGTYQMQRCSDPKGSSVVCTLWSTGSKDQARALEAQFDNSHLFKDVAATNS